MAFISAGLVLLNADCFVGNDRCMLTEMQWGKYNFLVMLLLRCVEVC